MPFKTGYDVREKLRALTLSQDYAEIDGDFTPENIAKSMEKVNVTGRHVGYILLTKDDYEKLPDQLVYENNTRHPFKDWFDSHQDRSEAFEAGFKGMLLGMYLFHDPSLNVTTTRLYPNIFQV